MTPIGNVGFQKQNNSSGAIVLYSSNVRYNMERRHNSVSLLMKEMRRDLDTATTIAQDAASSI